MPEDAAARSLLLWRAFVPRWAYDPLSGEGAARFGGRWNRLGQACLYAAREPSTAFAEYNQGFVQHPAILVQLVLEHGRLADLTRPATMVDLGLPVDLHATQWREDLDHGRVPATHGAAERLTASGFDGVLYPSHMSRGGVCAAVWRWNVEGGPRLSAVDPEGRLPKGPASWL